MKLLLVLATLVSHLACTSAMAAENSALQPTQAHKLSIAAFRDTFAKPEWFFLLNSRVAYRSLDALKADIGKIVPSRSTLNWEVNDMRSSITCEGVGAPHAVGTPYNSTRVGLGSRK